MSTAWVVAYALLAGVTGVLALLLLALARYVGVISTRLPQPVPLELDQGPEVGTQFAEIALPPEAAELLRPREKHDVLLVFLSTHCAACTELVGELNLFVRDRSDLDVITVVAGEPSGAERIARALSVERTVLDPNRSLLRALRISTVPFALMYRRGTLVARGVVNSRDMLESLAAGHVRPHGDALVEAFAAEAAAPRAARASKELV